tara:strand:+ start:279 stop:1142 length:864 start_codon:yes stop_codon:yes gene_type:complete
MPSIPFKALRLGALSPFSKPIKYGKSKVSGSDLISYILHCRSGLMPGQPNLFAINYLTPPKLETSVISNTYIRSFQLQQKHFIRAPIGENYSESTLNKFTYEEYIPHDDEAYKLTILATYRQIFGNFHLMESEREIDLERKLRNGDLTVKEFIRRLAKSNFYKEHYFQSVTQQRFIELSFKHLLGRPPVDQIEIIRSIKLMHDEGFENYIDHLIDSSEYYQIFGDFIVPYQRCFDSPCGIKTSVFCNALKLNQSFATSDNAINYKSKENPGVSIMLNDLAECTTHPN